ncbi:MAG: flagellar protein [Lachnospiraceae bacterium]|nr:flagellar protein [Lachnospiraceae bacterium]
MNVRNCRKCGKIFNYVAGPPICPNCRKEQEDKFQEVKKYVYEHPGVGIHEVSRECEVETSQIQQWIREERLEFSTDSDIGLTCEKCGAMIRSGRFCEKCKNEMANGFNAAIGANKKPAPVQKKPEKENPRMRFLNN